MRNLFIFFVFLSATPFGWPQDPAVAGAQEAACAAANTQAEINQCVSASYQKVDKQLNDLYASVMKKLTPAAQAKLGTVQRLWIRYRNENCDAAAAAYEGGSIQASVKLGCLDRNTRARINELQHVYSSQGQ